MESCEKMASYHKKLDNKKTNESQKSENSVANWLQNIGICTGMIERNVEEGLQSSIQNISGILLQKNEKSNFEYIFSRLFEYLF